MSLNKNKGKSVNIVTALRKRSTAIRGCNSYRDLLHLYAEHCAATLCTNNKKVNLPPRTRSTFMTAFSPDHKLMASCHGDHNIHVTDISSRKVLKSLVGHVRSPWCISFHPSSRDILATGCLNGEVRVWDLRGGGSESWTSGANEPATITSLSFHPTDHVLLIGTGNEIYFWDWSIEKPFAAIKTSSTNERIQMVRFDMFGSHILTGIVNTEEEQNSAEDDDNDSDAVDWSTTPSSVGTQSDARTNMRRQWLRNWLTSASPVLSVTASRSSTSRPLTASYNLRGRHDTRPPTNPESSTTLPSSSGGGSRTERHERMQRSRRANRSSDSRWRVSDYTRPHTYSRDHERILHARVSVNAEIQHQYNRLQLLRQERRRLEMRLQQLHYHPRSLAASSSNSQQTETRNNSTPDSSTPGTWNPLPSSIARNPEQEAHEDYTEITELLVARLQARLLQTLNDDNVEVSVNWGSNSTGTSTQVTTSPSQSQPNEAAQNSSTTDRPTVPLLSAQPGLINEPIDEPGSYGVTNIYPTISSFLVPQSVQQNHGNNQQLYLPPLATPSSNNLSIPAPDTANPLQEISNRSSQDASTSLGPYHPPLRRQIPLPDPEPVSNFSRISQQRARARLSRHQWRLRRRNRSHIGHIFSFPEGHSGRDKTTHRLQWWDFSKLQMPEISRSDLNVVVPQCKIHNDSSVDISKDGSKLAALIWSDAGFPDSIQVGVFSLETKTLGQLLYRKHFGQNAVCLSLSPLGNYLAVGLKYLSYLSDGLLTNSRTAMAQILKLTKLGDVSNANTVHQVTHPTVSDTPQRFVNINTIAWLPTVGQGILYGTNHGELRICYTAPNSNNNSNNK